MAGQTQLSARLGMDNGIFKHDIPAKVKRSSFPYGRKRDFCLDPGMIVPIDLWETLPGDYFEVKLDYLLKSFPLKVPPFTTYKVRTHWYYCKKVDLWKGALTYMVKGRSHSISLSNPLVKVHSPYSGVTDPGSGTITDPAYADLPMSLSSFFGFQPGHYAKTTVGDYCRQSELLSNLDTVSDVHEFYGGVTALPFFMYQKIYRLAYLKPNLLQNSKAWFPDDMSDGWRINYSKSNLFDFSSTGNDCFFNPVSEPSSKIANTVPSVNDTAINIFDLRYAMFEDDRFTTALPWSTRGNAPQIDISGDVEIDDWSDFSISLQDKTAQVKVLPYNGAPGTFDLVASTAGSNPGTVTLSAFNTTGVPQDSGKLTVDAFSFNSGVSASGSASGGLVSGIGFNINDLRAKIALTVWQERNATTYGYYNEMIYAHFNENPDSQDYEPRYLGGTSDVVSFSEVIQHDNAENDSTPQGHAAGLGQVRSGGQVFSYSCKDYGYIMGVMIIQPETVYNSRIEKLWTRKIQEDEYFPEYQALGLQEILKGEVWPSGTSSDNDLFGYQERDTEYKTRDNMAIGFFALPHTTDRLMSAYSLCREFSSQPSLSQQFVTMSPQNMRKDCLAVPSMPFFRCSLVTSVHAVRPMSYKTSPNTFGF